MHTPSRALGITGSARNRMDDSVEAMLQVRRTTSTMCDWLRDGMPAAWLSDLDVPPVPPPLPRYDRFERLPTL